MLSKIKNAIKYWSRMNENWHVSIGNVPKNQKAIKNDIFVTSKTKICLFYLFYLFYEINTKLSVDSFYFSSYPFRKSPE